MPRSGLIATKMGNSSYYQNDGTNTHVTILKVDECIVSNIRTKEKDGYNALKLSAFDVKESKISKPIQGVFKKLDLKPKKFI